MLPPSLEVRILSFSCSFRQKNLQNNRLAHPQENPGSATDRDLALSLSITKFVKLLSSNINLAKLKFCLLPNCSNHYTTQ